MNNSMIPILLMIAFLISALVVVTVGLLIRKKFNQHLVSQTGVLGEMQVATILSNFARQCPDNQMRVLNNVYLPLYDTTTQLDHILVGKFGILVVESKNMGGHIYGSPEKRHWKKQSGGQSMSFYNPLMQNRGHVNCLMYWLRKSGVEGIYPQSLVVFASNNVQIHIPKGSPVVTLSILERYLSKSRYRKDNGVDVDQICSIIERVAISDPKRIRAHTGQVKKIALTHKDKER